jgi:hypothetical protein
MSNKERVSPTQSIGLPSFISDIEDEAKAVESSNLAISTLSIPHDQEWPSFDRLSFAEALVSQLL